MKPKGNSIERIGKQTKTGLAAALGILAIAVGIAMWLSSGDRAPSAGSGPTVKTQTETTTTQADIRTVVVSGRGSHPTPSQPDSPMHARLVKGKVPRGVSVATVQTDEDCGADSAGISNCLNRLRLEDGSFLEIRHPHDMREVPCLSPGEKIRLKAA